MSDAEIVTTVVGPARLLRSNRKTLAISVHPDGAITLAAPVRAPLDAILAKVVKRAPWIQRQQRTFTAMNADRPSLRYSSGATHRYLGRQYRLKVEKGSPSVKLVGGYFHVTSEAGDEAEVQRLLSAWLRQRAAEQFSRRLAGWRTWCENRGIPEPKMGLRTMPKRWGSAQSDGRLFFNPDLVRVPSICIDYVIAHEICHLKYPHHGPQFYRTLDEAFPQWRAVKDRLERAEA